MEPGISAAEDFHICGKCTNVECEVHEDNLIGSIASVMSSEECQNWCKRRNDYMNDCRYVTYVGNEGLPFQNLCYMFSSCGKKSECTNCVTETFDCLCSTSTVGKIKGSNQNQGLKTKHQKYEKMTSRPQSHKFIFPKKQRAHGPPYKTLLKSRAHHGL